MQLIFYCVPVMANPLSRSEISFIRLLTRCENFVQARESNEWRLEQYVKNLEERLLELQKMNTCQPSKDTLADYTRRVEFLKGIVEAEKLPNVTEKALANQLLSPGTYIPTSNKLHQQTKAQYLREMREELLSTKEDSSTTSDKLRLRHVDANSADDFDAVMQYHNSMQEKVAQEMMSLVQNLKQNSLLAGHIIRKDTEITALKIVALYSHHSLSEFHERKIRFLLQMQNIMNVQSLNQERSNKFKFNESDNFFVHKTLKSVGTVLQSSSNMADDRYSELKVQSEKLEVHAKKSCNWCVWLMLAAVCLIFMWMIVFIRLFPKR